MVIGASTAFFAATVGLVQNDIKRVIAYSTCSQLGYMFVAAGVGAYPVAMFHLFTHAFFKALLFLGAGSVITAMHHEQDMRDYGGLRAKIPLTFWAMVIGTLAITGVGDSADPHRLRRVPSEGRDHRERLRARHRSGGVRLHPAGGLGLLHQLLQLAADLHDVLRPSARRPPRLRPCPREPAQHADPARRCCRSARCSPG